MDNVYDAMEAIYIFVPVIAIIVLVIAVYLNATADEKPEMTEAMKQELETILRKED